MKEGKFLLFLFLFIVTIVSIHNLSTFYLYLVRLALFYSIINVFRP